MPTGYTANVEINPDLPFKDFALLCARAFGACISMRDEPLNTPIPEKFGESDYYSEKIEELTKTLTHYTTSSLDILNAEFEKDKQESIETCNRRIEEKIKLKEAYSRLIEEANAWIPPSDDHTELKTFMIKQLVESQKFDCDTDWYQKELQKLSQLSYDEWFKTKVKETENTLTRTTEYLLKDKESNSKRNLWIKQLRDSL